MSTAFSISFDQTSEQDSPESAREQVSQAPPGPGEENGQQEGSHPDILAWEVDFTSTGNDSSQQKTKKIPKFLREREKARQARMEQLKRESETTPRSTTSPQATSKRGTNPSKPAASSPQVMKSKIPSPKFSASSKQRTVPPARPASALAGSLSSTKIKRSPPIKQPLLLVQSGQQAKSAERKALSSSNSPLTGNSRSPNNKSLVRRPASAKTNRELNRVKSKSYTSLIRPTSARTSRELPNRQDKGGFAADFNSPPLKEEKVTKEEVTPLKSKKVVLNCLLYTKLYINTLLG
jgi:hypothetical protein